MKPSSPQTKPKTPRNWLELIDAWAVRGWLRPLDLALVQFLASLDPDADGLCLLAAALASHQLGRGHVCLDLAATLDDPDAVLSLPPEADLGAAPPLFPSAALAGTTVAAFETALSASILVGRGPGPTPLVLDGGRLYLRRYWEYERQAGAAIRERLTGAAETPADLRRRLDALFPRREGATGPDWQKVACAVAARGRFTVITGGPGTGKTTSVVRLLALLQGAAREAGRLLRIRLAAPTGKAAARLTESIGDHLARLPAELREGIPAEAATLHRLLGARPDTRSFRHGADNPLHADLVVIDEASMIDLEMMAALLAALCPDTRLVLLGDKDQLASVEAGSVLGDLCRDADEPGYRPGTVAWIAEMAGEDAGGQAGEGGALDQRIVCLRESHRFTAGSGIGRLARAVNAGAPGEVEDILASRPAPADVRRIVLRQRPALLPENLVLEGGDLMDAAEGPGLAGYRNYLKSIGRRPAADAGPEAHLAWAGKVLDEFGRFQVLCALRSGPFGTEGLNRRIADILAAAGLIGQTQGWYEGRPVLVARNDYGLGLMNGDIGIALAFPIEPGASESVGEARLRVVFRQPDRSLKLVLPSRLSDIETVYAMTVHKSQGSEFDHVALVLPDRPSPVLTRELVYTGITRAKSRLSLVLPEPSVLPEAVLRRVRRSGRLADLCG